MSAAPKLDRYGRPCPIARALERFDFASDLTEAREKPGDDLAHWIARTSNELIDRFQTEGRTMEAAINVFSESTDEDTARALLQVLNSYHTRSATLAFELAAATMAALERGNLIPALTKGASHG